MNKIVGINEIISYREMCDIEKVQTLQRGMNYRLNLDYSVLLMSQRSNAPYKDSINEETGEIEYEGHDVSKNSYEHQPKLEDQIASLPSGKLTQNGKFIEAVKLYKLGKRPPELVKVYEKVFAGVWSLKGVFDLIDYKIINDGKRYVFKFILKLSSDQKINVENTDREIEHTRIIPSFVKQEV